MELHILFYAVPGEGINNDISAQDSIGLLQLKDNVPD